MTQWPKPIIKRRLIPSCVTSSFSSSWEEHWVLTPEVEGSGPSGSTI